MGKLSFEQLTYLKMLLSVEGIGPAKLRNLLTKFRSLDKVITADLNSLKEVPGISVAIAAKIRQVKPQKNRFEVSLHKELESLEKTGGKILTIWDEDYPPLLKKIYDPPIILYYKGTLEKADEYSIAVVGTREPTPYGKLQAEKISSELIHQNITIVSGMARGVDSVAHRTAVKNNKRTVAVTGSGLDIVYPSENKKLFDEIAGTGLVLTEYPLGTKPDAQNFPRRNRIISGLSLGCIVIETGITGGAMQTAAFALDQNREVFAVPGNLGIKQSEGTNLLIQKGEAKLVKCAEDVLVELELKLKPILGKNIPRPKPELNLFEEKIIGVLKNNPQQIDKIASLTELSTSDCLVHLLSLEFKGVVKQLPGKVFALL